ncbi:hypothetical protein [Nostoc sp.]
MNLDAVGDVAKGDPFSASGIFQKIPNPEILKTSISKDQGSPLLEQLAR